MKKMSIKLEINCKYENLNKYLPVRYTTLVSKSYYNKIVNIISFSIDKTAITSGEIIKAQKKSVIQKSKLCILLVALLSRQLN